MTQQQNGHQGFRIKPAMLAVLFACSLQHSGMLLADYRDTTQVTLPTLEVAAEKRAAQLINIPMSVTAKSGAELDDANTQSITELSRDVPNVHMFSWGGRRDSNIFIRGIGPGLFTEPTVGFYVDGVNYLGNGMFDLDFLDIERVEVLRGPQGTLYGGNSLAGVVNVTTRKPGNTPEAKVQLQTHNKGMQSVKATVSAPIIKDELFWSLSFAGTNADGYTKSAYTDKKIDGREDYSMRSRVRWTPNDRLELNWIVDAEDFRGGSYSYAPLEDLKRNRYISTTVLDGRDNRNSLGSSVQLQWKGDSMDFTSVTGWRHWKSQNYVDQFLPAYGFYDSLANDKQTQLTQEFRLSSNQEQRLKWIAGFYAYDTNAYSNSTSNADYTGVVMGGPFTDRFNYKKDSYGHAFFGQLDYKLTDTVTLTGGLRRDDETRKVDASVDRQTMGATYDLNGKMSFSKWLPKGTISYAPDSATHWYASIGKGYRAGGFDTLYLDQAKPSFKSEESINYEIGLKKKLLEERAEFSASLFRIDIKDQQVQRIIPSVSAFNILTDNAGKGQSQGFETELKLLPARGWLIAAGAGYTHTEFKEYQYDANTDYSGNRLPFAPQFNANLGVQHRRPINDSVNLFARADLQYVGTHYFDAANEHKQDGYTLVNFKIGLEGERWDAYLWAKNLTDKFYSTVITQQGPTPLAALGAPRFVGVTLNLHY